MKKFVLVLLALAAVLAVTPAAKADSFSVTWLQFVGTGDAAVKGTFTFTVDTTTNHITAATLNITGTNVPYFPVGTATLVSSLYFGGGLGSMTFMSGGYTINLFNFGTGWQLEQQGINSTDLFLNTSVPEPSSLILLGTGLFLLAAGLFWKSRSKAHLAKLPNVIQAA